MLLHIVSLYFEFVFICIYMIDACSYPKGIVQLQSNYNIVFLSNCYNKLSTQCLFQTMAKVRVMREDDKPSGGTKVGEKLCKHKYSSSPYCYNEITDNPGSIFTCEVRFVQFIIYIA